MIEEKLSSVEATVAILAATAVATTAAQRRIPLISYQVHLWNFSKSLYQWLSKL